MGLEPGQCGLGAEEPGRVGGLDADEVDLVVDGVQQRRLGGLGDRPEAAQAAEGGRS
jgi:hypothetical protein